VRFHRPLKRAEHTLKKDLSENFCGELKKTRAVAELIGMEWDNEDSAFSSARVTVSRHAAAQVP